MKHGLTRRMMRAMALFVCLVGLSAVAASALADGISGTVNGPVGLFVNGSTEALHITTAGNVGIGTTGATQQLQIVPSSYGLGTGLYLGANYASGSYTGLAIDLSTARGGYATLQSFSASGSTYGNLVLNANGGNVGIGTISPGFPLQVIAPSTASWASYFGNSDGYGVILGAGGATYGAIQATEPGVTNYVNLILEPAAGNVGIKMTGPNYPLDVVGDIRTSTCLHYASSTLGTCSSDARIKRDIKPFALGLSAVTGLQPVTFYYNGLAGNPDDGRKQIGYIAQDVEKVVPDMVSIRAAKLHPEDKALSDIKAVDYGEVSYMLVNAVKELKHLFDSEQDDVARLKAANDTQAKEIEELRAEFEAYKKGHK